MNGDGWLFAFDGFAPERQGLREALCTLGNGYFCTRGAFEWAEADAVNYPGTYLAGGYNRLCTDIAGRTLENEDLVNLPNWLCLRFRIGDGDWFNPLAGDVLSFRRELDLKRGVLGMTLRFRDKKNRETTLRTRRLVHMGRPHLAAIEMTLTPENWSERVEILSALDGRVINAGVPRYRDLAGSHLLPCEAGAFAGQQGEEMVALIVQASQSKLRVAEAARTRVACDGRPVEAHVEAASGDGHVSQLLAVEASEGQAVTVEKVVALYCSRDVAIASPDTAAREAVAAAPAFGRLLASHARAWQRLWDRCDIVLEDGPETQTALRLHIFHLLQTLSPNSIELDIGVPARGWHGEAYRGHVFWDELFILPFLTLRLPAVSRAMLRYRYNRLDKARAAAGAAGHSGAMFPWQSGSDGREETQVMHLNPRSGRWLPDNSGLQRHVGLAVAYNVWHYVMATGEKHFLVIRGMEMLVEIARFFTSLANYVPETDRFEILGVMGPDEYHDAYPGADKPGLDNNAYTNVMVAWLMETVIEAFAVLDDFHRREIVDLMAVGDDEMARWQAMSRRMKVPFHDGVVSQFDGYENLDEFDWQGYRAKYGDIQRLDRILEAEGDSTNRYKLSKQADVLMLFYLFSRPRLEQLMARLGYAFDEEMWRRTIEYYMARTSHGSTLSYVVHSWVLARSQPEAAWHHFKEALRSDISDIQGGTTAEGIHLGAMAGTIDLVQRCFIGLDIRDGELHFDPVLTERLRRLKLRLRYLGHWLDVEVTQASLALEVHESWTESVPVRVRGQFHRLEPGRRHVFDLAGS